MMGIEVPETCSAYHKCNKAYSDIYLVFSSLRLCNDARTDRHQVAE